MPGNKNKKNPEKKKKKKEKKKTQDCPQRISTKMPGTKRSNPIDS